MAGIATGSSAPASRQILLRTMHSISGSTEFGAALWRQGFLYILETRLVPIVDLQLQHIRERTQRLQQSAVTTSTFSDHGAAEAQFEQIYEDQLRDAHLVHSFTRPISLDDGSLARAVLDGTERVTDALTMAELVRQIYPTSDRLAREHILGFVREAPLTWGYWAGWKWLYKQAEADIDIELLAEAHRRLEHEPAWLIPEVSSPVPFINRYPSPSTIRYLRRRMRRYQEKLHSSNPDQWLALQRALHVHHSPSEVDSIVVTMPIAEANNILERPTDTDDDASLFWNETTSAESREAVLVTLRRMIEQDVSRARPMLDSLVARMNVESAPVPEPARLAVCRFLSTVLTKLRHWRHEQRLPVRSGDQGKRRWLDGCTRN